MPDSDLEMGGGGGGGGVGGGEKVGGRSPKEVFLALRASVGLKIRGGGSTWAIPLDPPLVRI